MLHFRFSYVYTYLSKIFVRQKNENAAGIVKNVRVGETGVGEVGQIVGETAVDETEVDKMAMNFNSFMSKRVIGKRCNLRRLIRVFIVCK